MFKRPIEVPVVILKMFIKVNTDWDFYPVILVAGVKYRSRLRICNNANPQFQRIRSRILKVMYPNEEKDVIGQKNRNKFQDFRKSRLP